MLETQAMKKAAYHAESNAMLKGKTLHLDFKRGRLSNAVASQADIEADKRRTIKQG